MGHRSSNHGIALTHGGVSWRILLSFHYIFCWKCLFWYLWVNAHNRIMTFIPDSNMSSKSSFVIIIRLIWHLKNRFMLLVILLLCVIDLTLASVFIFYFINLSTYYISFLMFYFFIRHIQAPMAYFVNLLSWITHHDRVQRFD